MADNWQPGDLALCVKEGLIYCSCGCAMGGETAPHRGAVREVHHVLDCEDVPTTHGFNAPCREALLMFDAAGDVGGHHSRFRKINPLSALERETFLVSIKHIDNLAHEVANLGREYKVREYLNPTPAHNV